MKKFDNMMRFSEAQASVIRRPASTTIAAGTTRRALSSPQFSDRLSRSATGFGDVWLAQGPTAAPGCTADRRPEPQTSASAASADTGPGDRTPTL
jgi:hypothetical protein